MRQLGPWINKSSSVSCGLFNPWDQATRRTGPQDRTGRGARRPVVLRRPVISIGSGARSTGSCWTGGCSARRTDGALSTGRFECPADTPSSETPAPRLEDGDGQAPRRPGASTAPRDAVAQGRPTRAAVSTASNTPVALEFRVCFHGPSSSASPARRSLRDGAAPLSRTLRRSCLRLSSLAPHPVRAAPSPGCAPRSALLRGVRTGTGPVLAMRAMPSLGCAPRFRSVPLVFPCLRALPWQAAVLQQ